MNENTLKIICEDEEGNSFPLQKVATAAYKKLKQVAPLVIELSFVSEEEIQTLNRDHRGIDRSTDVLSFPYLDEVRYKTIKLEDYEDEAEDGELLIGSVCIYLERAKEQAKEYGHSLEREVCYLTLHGILHCFGYDHIESGDEEEMTSLAEEIMKELRLTR